MLNFDLITDNIAVGSCPTDKTDLQLLKNANITAILNLQSFDDFKTHKINFDKLETQAEKLDMVIYHKPMIEFDEADIKDKLNDASLLLNRLLNIGHHVYVHCNAGIERSPTVILDYLVKYQTLSVDDANAMILAKRQSAPKTHLI